MATVISVENLGKRYIIGHQRQEQYLTLRETIAERSKEAGRRLLHPFLSSSGQPFIGMANTEEFWALKAVSFDVQQGERLGIIGRNGAGKTTLLKVLSRITEPTTGRFAIKGRVASLLEVGTGFHPELTGRENIFLNGAVLGMGKTEIKKKFDEIVDFAEVEKFLDTPVKRYSSGMSVRLAFAVAAHLEPEILILDEVLAVGDVQFQKKCLGRMEELGNEARTVLFVSHNMAAIQRLCQRAVWIDAGQLVNDGETERIVTDYVNKLSEVDQPNCVLKPLGDLQIERVTLRDDSGKVTNRFKCGEAITVDIQYLARREVCQPYFWLAVKGAHGNLFGASMLLDGQRPESLLGGGSVKCRFPEARLTPGYYAINMGIREKTGKDLLVETGIVANLEVAGSALELGLQGEVAAAFLHDVSVVMIPYEWHLPDGKICRIPAQNPNVGQKNEFL